MATLLVSTTAGPDPTLKWTGRPELAVARRQTADRPPAFRAVRQRVTASQSDDLQPGRRRELLLALVESQEMAKLQFQRARHVQHVQ